MLRTFLNNLFTSREKKLEEARLNLEASLRDNDMRFLIDVMCSDALYSPLLKNQRGGLIISSTDNVSWYAYRRAEELHTDDEKAQLLDLLTEFLNDHIKRRSIVFSLAHLCTNRTDTELFNFLMKHLENEKDADCRTSLLIGIEEMDKTDGTLNIEPIKNLAKKRSRDKTNAILALAKTNDKEVEPLLLELFTATKDSHTKNMICSPLETVGTEACIPILEAAYKKTRDAALRSGIEYVFKAVKK